MKNWRWWVAIAAALAGILVLVLWFGEYWPGSTWQVVPRDQLIAKGRGIAQHFGVDVKDWKVYVVATVPKHLAQYGRSNRPLAVRITYVSRKDDDRRAEVGFDSNGTLSFWRAPDQDEGQGFGSAEAAGQAGFQYMAGDPAGAYETPSKASGDEANEEEFTYRQAAVQKTGLKERIKVTTKGQSIEKIERSVYSPSSDDDDNDEEGYWGFLAAGYGVIYVVCAVVGIAIFLLWRVRKALSRRFHVRLAAGLYVLMLIATLAGSMREKSRSGVVDFDTIAPPIALTFMVVAFAAVGRGISSKTRKKWISLEEICRLAPIAKPTGEAIAAGILFGPLLAAVPFLIVGSGRILGSHILPNEAALLYSRAPMLDSIPFSAFIGLLMIFGFLMPALEQLLHFRWVRWIVMLPAGTVFFSDLTRVVAGPIAAPLTAGFLTLILLWFVWAKFDILALLTTQLTAALVMGLVILAQKGISAWTFAATLGGLMLAAAWCYWRGQAEAVGDPAVAHPSLTGFRAEREKLLAEFSVARRAQQDMLPQTAPKIPGYSIAAACTPSLEVGGDLYDFLRLEDGRIGIGVADVSGKGVPAALYMTLTKGLLSAVSKDTSELGQVMEEVNRHLHGVTRKKTFVTMALGFLDAEKRVMQCVRAGHNPMVWRQKLKSETTLVTPGGLGLGITGGRIFGNQLKVEELALADGDAVVFYSDGITEAMNRDLEQFGEQRLMEAVERADGMHADAARDSILSEVRTFLDGVHPQDDMTIVVLRVGE